MRYIYFLALLCFVSGCAAKTDYTDTTRPVSSWGRVAVIPFVNVSGTPNAGRAVTELFVAELTAKQALELAPQDNVNALLLEFEGMDLPPKKLAEITNADTLILGHITEYAYKQSLGEDPAVGITLRAIDAKTGAVLWSASRSGTGRYSWVREDSLSRLAQGMCRHLVYALPTSF